jgi:hypothetical protein
MHKIKVDRPKALIDISLSATIDDTEVVGLVDELRREIASLRGRRIRILVDARFLHPLAPTVTEQMPAVQEYGISAGVVRVAEVVESSVVKLQRGRVMRESGADPVTRTFGEFEEARAWLVSKA